MKKKNIQKLVVSDEKEDDIKGFRRRYYDKNERERGRARGWKKSYCKVNRGLMYNANEFYSEPVAAKGS